jgi:hypothetical protein
MEPLPFRIQCLHTVKSKTITILAMLICKLLGHAENSVPVILPVTEAGKRRPPLLEGRVHLSPDRVLSIVYSL